MKKYRITADALNIILQEKKVIKGGKKELTKSKVGDIHWVNIAYFPNVQTALDHVIEREIKETWVDDLKEMVKRTENIKQMVKDMLSEPLPKALQ